MPVQDTIESLTTVAASNYPAGTDSIGTSLDDYLRSIQAILCRMETQGAALTSTASMSLAAATGGYVHVTGTDTIAHLGTARAGVLRTLAFDDTLTLTHNATNLILPSGADITTAAGDVAVFRSEGSGNWRCVSYSRVDGLPLVVTAGGTTFANLTVQGVATFTSIVVNATATISALAVLGKSTLNTLVVTGAATFSTVEILKTAVFDAEVNRGTFSTTTTIDWTSGNKQRVVLGANLTFAFTAPPGVAHLLLKVVQDGTGSRNPGWPASVKWPGGTEPTWSTGAAAIDIVSLYYDGTSYYSVASTGFA